MHIAPGLIFAALTKLYRDVGQPTIEVVILADGLIRAGGYRWSGDTRTCTEERIQSFSQSFSFCGHILLCLYQGALIKALKLLTVALRDDLGGSATGIIAPQYLSGQGQIGDGAFGLTIKGHYRLTKAWRFGETNIAGNTGAVNTITKVLDQLGGDIVSQA